MLHVLLPKATPTPGLSGGAVDDTLDDADTSFEDDYALHAILGDGMTAVVFLAMFRPTNQLCACKVAKRADDGVGWLRRAELMRHECAMLARCGHHPNLVQHQ